MVTWTITDLADLRELVTEALQQGTDLEVTDYTDTARFVPPVAVVVPDGLRPLDDEEGQTFNAVGAWVMPVNVLVLADPQASASELDQHTFQCLKALSDFDIVEIAAPNAVTLRTPGYENTYWGTVIALEFITHIKEG